MRMEARAIGLPPPVAVDAAMTSLLLDFDGTLVSLFDDPADVTVDDDLTRLIARLLDRLSGRVAIISGRSIAQLDALLGPIADRLSITGSHGSEHRWDRVDARPMRPAALDDVAARFTAFTQGHPGTLVEVKSFGVALHYRRAPACGGAADALARSLAARSELAYQPGNMVAEVRVPGSDKGTAVSRLMQRLPMAGTLPVFLGDDLTDEAGFAAATKLGGYGVAVGSRPSEQARYALADVAAVHDWLRTVAA